MISHKEYMEFALKLAERGRGLTSPNPMVGCVIVKRGSIIGKGAHMKAGREHAEVLALREAGRKAAGSTMYVNLEPCSHWGRTPPCTQKIIESGVREVIIAMKDPNSMVHGCEELKSKGIRIKTGIMEEEARILNAPYIRYITTHRPFVILKMAVTVDGKIATSNGDSKYITSKESRTVVHKIRTEVDAIMVGIKTVLQDNPRLTPRFVKGKDPIKVVVDSSLSIPEDCRLMESPSKLIIATTAKASAKKAKILQEKGVEILIVKSKDGMVELKELMKILGEKGIASMMIEGGSKLNTSAIKGGIVDKVMIFTAPKMLGEGIGVMGDLGIRNIGNAIKLKKVTSRSVGEDMLLEGYL